MKTCLSAGLTLWFLLFVVVAPPPAQASGPLLPALRPKGVLVPFQFDGFRGQDMVSDAEFVYLGFERATDDFQDKIIRFRIADGKLDPAWAPSIGGHKLCLTKQRLFFARGTGLAEILAADLKAADLAPFSILLGNHNLCIENPGCFLLASLQAGSQWVYSGGLFLAEDYPDLHGKIPSNLVRIDQVTGAAEAVRLREIEAVGGMAADAERLYVGSTTFDAAGPSEHLLVAIGHSDITRTCWVVPLGEGSGEPFLKDGVLWVSGDFREVAGQPRAGLATLDPATGALLPETVRFQLAHPFVKPSFRILAAEGDQFVVAGDFTSVNGLPRQGLAILDFRTGEVLSWNPLTGNEGRIESVAVTTNAVYVLGRFYEIGGVARRNFVVFDRLAVPQLRLPQLTAAGFTAQVTAAPGYAHVLQRSADLQNWQTLSTNTPTNAIFTVQDKAPATSPQFYRLLVR